MSKGLPRSLRKLYDAISSGAVSGSGVEGGGLHARGIGAIQKERLVLTDTPIVMVDNAGTVAFGSLKLFDVAEGLMLFHGAVMNLALTLTAAGIDADWNGDIGLGTVAANNGGGPLATTEQNLVPNTAIPQAVASVTTGDGQSTGTESGSLFDGTTTPVDVFLNILVDDADHDITTTPTNIIVNGQIDLIYTLLGDN